ncbi:class I adenylate-forming enzyme family protein [Micromonospora sp. NPDC049171]|uniref:class I adenylate-forming enzyme family protein n=1 Tax=Micromonospora sp. NPDC049171 TaxID=3155770 RepID=UPI0034000125
MDVKRMRAELAADPALGTGNLLTTLIARGEGLDDPALTFDTPVDDHPSWQPMSLNELEHRVTARAAELHRLGIRPRDPVAVYVRAAADQALTFLALARIGAVPALINGNLGSGIAAEYIRKRLASPVVITDAGHRQALRDEGIANQSMVDVATLGAGDPRLAPPPFQHHPDDPVVITHSSGTTGLPKAVAHSHHSLFAAVRHRLTLPKAAALDRMLVILPPGHAAMVIALSVALCNHVELALCSRQNGAYVLDVIEKWRPISVLGFSTTWSDLAGVDLATRDLSSVQAWWNTGDCAHEPHIRHLVGAGRRYVMTSEGVTQKPGSVFIDGLGSSEMGHSQFFITHTPDTDKYRRCIGRPHVYTDAVVYDDDARELPVGQVGQLGIKAPTLSLGYWNDSELTYRTRRNGYFLTGDLVFRNEEGYFFHVDRLVDAADIGDGNWVYTALAEERILASCPEVLECTVVAVGEPGEVRTVILLTLRDGGAPDPDLVAKVTAALEPAVAATVAGVLTADDGVLPFGATGKVRKALLRDRLVSGELLGAAAAVVR